MNLEACERPQIGNLDILSSPRQSKSKAEAPKPEKLLEELLEGLGADEHEFRQSVSEVGQALLAVFDKDPRLMDCYRAICHAERAIIFRVMWEDDQGKLRVNNGYRVQHSSALGPYKGGLRFHPSVNLSVCRFLAFEQTFKNSLTGLPMGGAKGGADVDPKKMSTSEMRRFCQAFMTELHRYIGPELDVPAGDIGVSSREIGYMSGTFTHLTQQMGAGAFSSKPLGIGGSCLRTESTGFGIAVMAEMVLKELTGQSLKGLSVAISGAGNVALHCALKITQMGARVITLSDSGGTMICTSGLTEDQIRTVMKRKLGSHGKSRLEDISQSLRCGSGSGVGSGDCEGNKDSNKDNGSGNNSSSDHSSCGGIQFTPDQSAWHTPCDVAIPCATQGEFSSEDLERLAGNRDNASGKRLQALLVGSNMGLTADAVDAVRKKVARQELVFAPDKLSNLAGVAVSYLEMTQNAQLGVRWKAQKVSAVMRELLKSTFDGVMWVARQQENNWDLWQASHVHAFMRLHEAMLEQGLFWQQADNGSPDSD